MAHYKLSLDENYEEDYSLIAIHCSEDSYKMAFLLNKFASLRLKRRTLDLEFWNDGLEVTFPIFEFEDQWAYVQYYLVANKCKSETAQLMSSGGLFQDVSEKIVTTYLIPEQRNVDFFLKIESDSEKVSTKNLLASINNIQEVISAYDVDIEKIKSRNNLIFS